jgi:chromosome segregation ATPase
MANNQLSARELEELKKLYRDIDSYTQSQAEAAALNAQNIGVARRELERLRKEYKDLASDVSNALDIFHDITQEISKQNLGINESKKGYRGLTSIAEKIQSYQQGITNLSSKEVEKLKDKVKQEQLRLTNAQKLLEKNIEILQKSKEEHNFEIQA